MSELRIETLTMPAAELGPENPLPPLRGGGDLHASKKRSSMPKELLDSMAWGHPTSILPYTMQDAYSRLRQNRAFRVAVLENGLLRATFLLEMGGRLWSLVHKPSGRELLYVNPVFQPANLAIRNAWFSGGVEWNVGIIGHSPFTCAPPFAAWVEGPDRVPILRLYEWERVRQCPFQMDFCLPDGSPVLLVRTRVVNPHDRAVPMYWWSNIAIPETADTRVVVPASTALRFNYQGVGQVPVPVTDGVDQSYAASLPNAFDFFYDIPDGRRRWITGLDASGGGLVQTSTDLLKGRKLFVWGMGSGGRRWQEFLSEPGQAYVEIQAGLARTQLEYLTMPAQSEWAWLEAYGLLEADPDAIHGPDWAQALEAVERALERLIPRQSLEAEFTEGAERASNPPTEILQRGSGWGALERLRREAAGEGRFHPSGLEFDDQSLGNAQAPWCDLLSRGTMPSPDPNEAPDGYLVQAEWHAMLEEALRRGRSHGWLAWLHAGVMRYHAGDREGARAAWNCSLGQAENAWALAGLGAVALDEGRLDEAADSYIGALAMKPSSLPLAVACGRALVEASRPQRWLDLLPGMPPSVRRVGRIRLLEAQASLAVGALDAVERVLAEQPVVSDIREGETSLSHLWLAYHEQRLSVAEGRPVAEGLRARVRLENPVPSGLDFRMFAE